MYAEERRSVPYWRGQEDIVLTGISCRLPESDNMMEFQEHLMNGDDMITDDNRRWEPGWGSLHVICWVN